MNKVDNFLNALGNLRDIFEYEAPYGNVELAGLVGLYEICFEQLKDKLSQPPTQAAANEEA